MPLNSEITKIKVLFDSNNIGWDYESLHPASAFIVTTADGNVHEHWNRDPKFAKDGGRWYKQEDPVEHEIDGRITEINAYW